MCFKKRNEPVRLAKKPVKQPINWKVIGLFISIAIIFIIMILIAWSSRNYYFYNAPLS